MPSTQLHVVVRHLHRLVGFDPVGQQSDGELLQRFLHKREEAAFEAKIKQEVKAAARRLQLEAKMAKVLVVKQRLGSRPGPRKRVGVAHTSRRAFKAAVRVPSSR